MIKAVLILLLAAGTATADIRLALWDWLAADEAVPLTWAAAGLNEGLVSYWAMRTSGTTVFDEYGTNNAVAVNGVLFGSAYGKRDDGAVFAAASNQYIATVNNPTNLNRRNEITISYWYNSAMENHAVASTASLNSQVGLSAGWQIRHRSDGKIRIATVTDSVNNRTYDTTSAILPTNKFAHVAVVIKMPTLTNSVVYVDGVRYDQWTLVASTGTEPSNLTYSKPLEIGATIFAAGRTEYFTGSIDEVAVWTRALSSNEVYNLYNTPLYAPYKE